MKGGLRMHIFQEKKNGEQNTWGNKKSINLKGIQKIILCSQQVQTQIFTLMLIFRMSAICYNNLFVYYYTF